MAMLPMSTNRAERFVRRDGQVSAGNKPVVRNQVPVVEALQRGRPERSAGSRESGWGGV